MSQIILVLIGVFCAIAGSVLGYYARQSIARKKKDTIEQDLQKKIAQAKAKTEKILEEARKEAEDLTREVQKENDERRRELLKTERVLLRREDILERKFSLFEKREKEFERKVAVLREAKSEIENLREEARTKLEKVAGLSRKEARGEVFKNIERDFGQEIQDRIRKLLRQGEERYEKRAKEIIAAAVQRYALSQAQELMTSTVGLPSEEIKGRIIGKEGRNIRTLENLTGAEIIVDDTPETVVISSFNPLRRQVAKLALEKLIKDGRIQPARIEETVERAQKELEEKIRQAGEEAVYETGIVDLPQKIVHLLGRLYFRLSYSQNVLLHSIEVAQLAAGLAEELGADIKVAKKAGLLHDIGKAVDQQVQGSHVEIGMKILEKFGIEKEIVEAMKAHHEEYEPTSLEAILVKVADQISGARPGARKDSLENYLKRLKDLEDIVLSFQGVQKVYAIQAGREVRVFVRPEEIGDLETYKLARDIAQRVQQALNYPGEIKVNVIRETRVVEYAR